MKAVPKHLKRKPMCENHRNPLDEIPSSKMRVIELDNGDYYYLNYENGKLQAGHTTNTGFYPEYEIEYDWDFSLDHNIESLYDLIEDNFRFESVSKVRKKARRLESMRIGTRTRAHKPIRKESMGSHLAEYQKWVDYDMERYGRISDRTMSTIRKAGLSVVKDQYGEYEVIAYDRKESLNRTNRTVKEKPRKRMREGWRGHPDIEMIWHGAWADPDLEYKGYTFNYWDIEDAMWEDFLEVTGHKDSEANDPEVEEEFNQYVIENAAYYLEDVIASGYFERNGMKYKSWHDMMHERFNRMSTKKRMRESMHRFNRHPVNRRK